MSPLRSPVHGLAPQDNLQGGYFLIHEQNSESSAATEAGNALNGLYNHHRHNSQVRYPPTEVVFNGNGEEGIRGLRALDNSSSDTLRPGQDGVQSLLAPPLSLKPIPLHRQISSAVRTWWLELLACLVALGSLFAIIGTTYSHQDLPLPRWPYNVSINTLVSIYIVAMKAATLLVASQGLGQLKWSWFRHPRPLSHLEIYDEASRGVWGSLALLWILRFKRLGPSIGAVVTILSTVMDPFGGSVASLPTTRFPLVRDDEQRQLRSGMQLGLFRTNATEFQVDVNCPSGNCDFPNYHSHRFHSECRDISDEVLYFNGTILCYASRKDECSSTITDRFLNHTERGEGAFTIDIPGITEVTNMVHVVNGLEVKTPSYMNVYDLQPLTIYALVVYADNKPQDLPASDDPWTRQGYGAAACRIRSAIYTYDGAVENGRFTERTTDITPLPLNDDWKNWYRLDQRTSVTTAIDIGCLTPTERKSLQRENYTIPNDTNWMAYSASLPRSIIDEPEFPLPLNFTDVSEKCIYRTTADHLAAIEKYFDRFITGRLYFSPAASYDNSANLDPPLDNIYQGRGNISANSLQETMDSIFQAIDIHGRNFAKDAGEPGEGKRRDYFPVTGVVYRSETCVSIAWAWLAFPATMNILTIIFMGILLRKHFLSSKWQGDPLTQHGYKTAVVPLLLHGLETCHSGGGEDETAKEKQKRMEGGKWYSRKGENMLVRFEGKGADWRLVEVQGDTHEA